jgi:hypothetical protein
LIPDGGVKNAFFTVANRDSLKSGFVIRLGRLMGWVFYASLINGKRLIDIIG